MPPSASLPRFVSPNRGATRATFKPRAGRGSRGKPNTAVMRTLFTCGVALCDALVIMGAAMASGMVYGHGTELHNCLILGLTVATLFVIPNIWRDDYQISRYVSFKGHAKAGFALWCIAMVCALVLAFLTKTSDNFSRGTAVILFFTGFGGVMLLRAALIPVVVARMQAGDIVARQIFLVGDEAMIRAFTTHHDPREVGLRLLGASVLRPEPESLTDDLALAAAAARVLRPDDIYIMVPWASRDTLEACIDTFLALPASIHLAPERFFDRFDDMHVVRTGAISSLHLVKRPLTTNEVVIKRVLDIVIATVALICLAPVFIAVALAIKIDSPGPVMFRQRRYGFNQEPFRILKFRSMRTLEDNATLRQVTRGDPRITAVGRFIRRTNMDELPQLLNVITGEMSLVGPRPHALAHDQAFERDVALYARRHNVRPGITGWAQVNGWRGETDTPEKVRGRVEHDLYYIDNWSLLFDLSILFRTAFSQKAYKNAR